MGSRVPIIGDARPQRLPTKSATTPPVIRRQFSVIIQLLNTTQNQMNTINRSKSDRFSVIDFLGNHIDNWLTHT